MPYWQQNLTTNISLGPFRTTGYAVSSALTTATVLVYVSKNGSTLIQQVTTALTYELSGYCNIPFTSATLNTVGKLKVIAYTSVAQMDPIWGEVLSSNNYAYEYGTSAWASPTDVWGHSTRTLTSGGVVSSGVWTESTRTLTSDSVGAAAVWASASRTLTSWGGASTWAAADVWSVAARTLTSGATTFVPSDIWSVATRTLTSYGGASTFLAADVWSVAARTLTSGATTFTPTDVWSVGTRTLTSAGVASSAVWDAAVDGTMTYSQAQKVSLGVLAGNSTGGGTTAVKFRDWSNTKDRASFTVTTDGNRALTTYDLT